MKLSDIFKFKLFEGSDKANLKIVNENFEIAEKELVATNKEIADKVTEINNKITELNGLLGGKLDVSKIANNLVTTEEGYALDARMGKNIKDQISDICFKRCDIDTEHIEENATIINTANLDNGIYLVTVFSTSVSRISNLYMMTISREIDGIKILSLDGRTDSYTISGDNVKLSAFGWYSSAYVYKFSMI